MGDFLVREYVLLIIICGHLSSVAGRRSLLIFKTFIDCWFLFHTYKLNTFFEWLTTRLYQFILKSIHCAKLAGNSR